MIRDLHTHSNASDGSLSPEELLAYASDHNVDVLAVTDHDTLGAYDQIGPTDQLPVTLIPGIELSTTWNGHGIHVLGLNVDPQNQSLRNGVARQQRTRAERARTIAERLTRLGIDNPYDAVKRIAGRASIGRPHFARHLVEIGKVRDIRSAFRKYLGAGKIGDVKQGWASMAEVIDWIVAAGGIPVLAHPAKYKLTTTKLRAMFDDFKEAGGQGAEVICGPQDASVTKRLAELVNDHEMMASAGSDFHHPAAAWSRPGAFPSLPPNVMPVWDAW